MICIYIAGRGHSGSTILDLLIGANSNAASLGEMISGLRRVDSGGCTCEKKILNCDFWGNIVKSIEKEDGFKPRDMKKLIVKNFQFWNFFKALFSKSNHSIYKLDQTLLKNIETESNSSILIELFKRIKPRCLFIKQPKH